MVRRNVRVTAIDLFCGVGGLSKGLQDAGIVIAGGFDLDPKCKYPFETNIGAEFFEQDVLTVTAGQLRKLWEPGSIRLLAGCAPCQPFSPHRRGADTSTEDQWSLLDEFGRLVRQTTPEIVTMENVTRIGKAKVFDAFLETLNDAGYEVTYRSCYGPAYGLPQHRRRLVLIASRIGLIEVPTGARTSDNYPTVRSAIGTLRPIGHGQSDSADPLHKSRTLTSVNLKRIRASRPGGTWHDWPDDLRSPCHRRETGATFRSVYARMEWDQPSPTITTMSHNYGTGRFGHPEQDRAITLREAAILQGFPPDYRFVRPDEPVEFAPLGRLIGNAVPPVLGQAIGQAILQHVESKPRRRRG